MDFETIVRTRYATKLFDAKKIPKEKIDKLLEFIQLTPSSRGLQPFKIIIVTNQNTKEQLKTASKNQEQITTCSHLLIFCAYSDVQKRMSQYIQQMKTQEISEEKISHYEQIIISFTQKASPEKTKQWAKQQVFLALGNALNGAKALGFDSCPMGGFVPEQYKEILKLHNNLHPVVLCPVGYAADSPRKKIRIPKEELFIWEK